MVGVKVEFHRFFPDLWAGFPQKPESAATIGAEDRPEDRSPTFRGPGALKIKRRQKFGERFQEDDRFLSKGVQYGCP